MFFGQSIFGQTVPSADARISQPVAPVQNLTITGGQLPVTRTQSRGVPILKTSDRTMTGGRIPVTGHMPTMLPVSLMLPWQDPVAQARYRTITGGQMPVGPQRVAYSGFSNYAMPPQMAPGFRGGLVRNPGFQGGLVRNPRAMGGGFIRTAPLFPSVTYSFGPPTLSAYGASPDGLGGLIGIGG